MNIAWYEADGKTGILTVCVRLGPSTTVVFQRTETIGWRQATTEMDSTSVTPWRRFALTNPVPVQPRIAAGLDDYTQAERRELGWIR